MSDLTSATTEELLSELGERIGGMHLLDHPQGAVVEILDVGLKDPPCLKPSVVRVNGTDVGLISRDGGIQIDVGDDRNPATVTLTLFPRSVVIGSD